MPGAFGEELAWRGFLFPELERMGSFTSASLVGGIVWALWHLPLILLADYHSSAPMAFQIAMFSVAAIGLSFVHNWFRLKSGGTWAPAFLHASHNTFFNNWFDPLMSRCALTDFVVTEFGSGLMLVSVLMAIYIWIHRDELPATTPMQIPNPAGRAQSHSRAWQRIRLV